MKYVVSQRVLETIKGECRKYPDLETGGILVGFRDSKQVSITHATGSGPNADRSSHHFSKDTPYLQSVLDLLGRYYQVNYLGVWHKHPQEMPFPSAGDVFSAMTEVSDQEMGLGELITPICVVERDEVKILPFLIKDNRFQPFSWQPVPHEQLVSESAESVWWYNTRAGRERLEQEMEAFETLGVSVDLRQGSDGTYRFHVPLKPKSPRRLIMLCHGDYPVTAPEVLLHDRWSNEYEPVASQVLNHWTIDRLLADVFREQREA